MEPTFQFNVSEFASKVIATDQSSAYTFLESDIAIKVEPGVDTNEILLGQILNINNDLITSSTESRDLETPSDSLPSTENINNDNPVDTSLPNTDLNTPTLESEEEISNFQIRSQIQGWKSDFMYDYVLVMGKLNLVNYSLLIPDSHTTLMSYNMKPEKENFRKFFRIRKYNKRPVYYLYDGKTSLDEAMWWIFEYPENFDVAIKKPTSLPSDAVKIFNTARIEAFKR
jgi:hypothetical protein